MSWVPEERITAPIATEEALTEAGASLLPVDVSVLAVTDFFGS